MSGLDMKTREQLARQTIKEMVEESGDSHISLSGLHGPKLSLCTGKEDSADQPQLTVQDIVRIQLDASLTDRLVLGDLFYFCNYLFLGKLFLFLKT